MIVWGTRLYGRCDRIEGAGQVATRFFHLWFIPLVPLQTMLVTSEGWDGWRGVPMPLSLRSVLVAWSRAFLFLAGLATLGLGGIHGLAALDHLSLFDLFGALCLLPTAGACFVSWWLVQAVTARASERRREAILAACRRS